MSTHSTSCDGSIARKPAAKRYVRANRLGVTPTSSLNRCARCVLLTPAVRHNSRIATAPAVAAMTWLRGPTGGGAGGGRGGGGAGGPAAPRGGVSSRRGRPPGGGRRGGEPVPQVGGLRAP